jgi:hypothetical protein
MSELWNDARELDCLCYDLAVGEWPRSVNRARIADLANGVPPFTAEEMERDGRVVNVNTLDLTRGLLSGRMQFSNGFLRPGKYFNCRVDSGTRSKRDLYGTIVTTEINHILKRSVPYFESMRAKFGLLMLHGIAPTVWTSEDKWCPRPLGVDDVLIPSGTELGFDNLPFFVIRRSFTGIELKKLTQSPTRDPGWNMRLVDSCLKWIDEMTVQMMGNYFPEIYAPEKVSEDIREMSRFTAVDQAPRITCFDIYAWDDSGGEQGWIRRIILDAWSTPSSTGIPTTINVHQKAKSEITRKTEGPKQGKRGDRIDPDDDDFLYHSGDRKVGQSWQNIIGFQFADLQSIFPARYHNTRGLGFLLYAPCHLNNRMYCAFNEAVFEALCMEFKVKTEDDVQRSLNLKIGPRSFIDETMMPIPANERWQVNSNLVQLGFQQNQSLISQSTGAFSPQRNFSQDRTEKTRYQVMAELQADTSMVGAAVEQAFQYQGFEDQEIFRRFLKPNSTDPDVRAFRAAVLRQGVPEELLECSTWNIEHERVMGAGNKTVEMQIAEWLMQQREKYDPDSQRKILKRATLMITGDAPFSDELVPDKKMEVSDSVSFAETAAGTLMSGLPVSIKQGLNQQEVITTLLKDLAMLIQKFKQAGGMAPPDKLQGMNAIAVFIQGSMKILAQDKEAKPMVTAFAKALMKLTNELKGFAQRLQEQSKKSQQGGNGQGGIDPKDAAKVKGAMMMAQVKAQNAKTSHADRTAQKRISFEQKLKQDQQQHQHELQRDAQKTKAELARDNLKAVMGARRGQLSSTEE